VEILLSISPGEDNLLIDENQLRRPIL